MKKGFIAVLIVAGGLVLTSVIYAHSPWGGHRMGGFTSTDIDAVKKFQKETLSLRDELITKRLELQKEYTKDSPDKGRIATLRKEIIDIELKIQEKADEAGLSRWDFGMMGRGMMGYGMMGSGMRTMDCPCQ